MKENEIKPLNVRDYDRISIMGRALASIKKNYFFHFAVILQSDYGTLS